MNRLIKSQQSLRSTLILFYNNNISNSSNNNSNNINQQQQYSTTSQALLYSSKSSKHEEVIIDNDNNYSSSSLSSTEDKPIIKYQLDPSKIEELKDEISKLDKQLRELVSIEENKRSRFDRVLMKRLLKRKNTLAQQISTPKPPPQQQQTSTDDPSQTVPQDYSKKNKLSNLQMRQDMFMSLLPITYSAPQETELDQLFTKFKYSPKLAVQQLKILLTGTYRVMMQPDQVDYFLERISKSIHKSTEVLNLVLKYYIKNDRLSKIVEVMSLYDNLNEMNTVTFELLYEYAEFREFIVLSDFPRLDVIQYILGRVVLENDGAASLSVLSNWNISENPLRSPLGPLIVYNEVTRNRNVLDLLERKLETLDDLCKDITINDIIGQYLSIPAYDNALQWYAKRIQKYRMLPNHHTIYKFLAFHTSVQEFNLDSYWMSMKRMFAETWRGSITARHLAKQLNLSLSTTLQSVILTVRDQKRITEKQDTFFKRALAEKNFSEIKRLLFDFFFAKNVIPKNTMLLRAVQMLFENDPNDYLQNVLPATPTMFKPFMAIPQYYSAILQENLEEGIKLLSREDSFLFSNSQQTWNDIILGLIKCGAKDSSNNNDNNQSFELISKMLKSVLVNNLFIQPNTIKAIGNFLYQNNRFDIDIIESLNEYSTKHNLQSILISHLNISHLIQKRRFKEAYKQFQELTDKRPRTFQVATELFLQKYSYSKQVATRLNFKWTEPRIEDLEWYLGISLSYNQVNHMTLSLVTATLAKDSSQYNIGQSLIKQYLLRENKQLSNDGQWNVFSRLMKALPNEKERIEFFKHMTQHQLNTSDLKLDLPFKLNENQDELTDISTNNNSNNSNNNNNFKLSASTINYITNQFIDHKVVNCVSSYIGPQ